MFVSAAEMNRPTLIIALHAMLDRTTGRYGSGNLQSCLASILLGEKFCDWHLDMFRVPEQLQTISPCPSQRLNNRYGSQLARNRLERHRLQCSNRLQNTQTTSS